MKRAMSLSTLFYQMPRLTILSVLIILAAGVGALFSLGRQASGGRETDAPITAVYCCVGGRGSKHSEATIIFPRRVSFNSTRNVRSTWLAAYMRIPCLVWWVAGFPPCPELTSLRVLAYKQIVWVVV